jgi:hypothetical protein
MPLPKIDTPIYDLVLPLSKKEIRFRPFLVKEQKNLLMAMESNDKESVEKNVKQVLINCTVTEDVDIEKLPVVDVEYYFLNLRARSVGEVIENRYRCDNEVNSEKCGNIMDVKLNILDIKVEGVSRDIMRQALLQAREGRLHILKEMEKVIKAPRGQISEFAPRIETIKIHPDKIREVIGAGGKVIRGITEMTGVKIEIEDDGRIHIASADPQATKRAIAMINDICAEAEVGKTYKGRVVKIADFGAFVEILPNTQGLLHISEIAHERIRAVTDVLSEGDELDVKVLEVDRAGRVKLSRKALLDRIQ